MRWTLLALVPVALAVGLAASSDPGATTAPADSPILISQKGKVFDRSDVTLKKGGSLIFRNDDPVTHNVFSRTEGSAFNLKMQKPGQEDLVTFKEVGDVTVRCAIHPTMKLTVHVEEE